MSHEEPEGGRRVESFFIPPNETCERLLLCFCYPWKHQLLLLFFCLVSIKAFDYVASVFTVRLQSAACLSHVCVSQPLQQQQRRQLGLSHNIYTTKRNWCRVELMLRKNVPDGREYFTLQYCGIQLVPLLFFCVWEKKQHQLNTTQHQHNTT